MQTWPWNCDFCGADAVMAQGKAGSYWYNCPACSVRLNFPNGSVSWRKVDGELSE